MFPWSVMPHAGIPAARTRGISSRILFAPSSSEYWVCRCRWTKDIPRAASSPIRPPERRRAPYRASHEGSTEKARKIADRLTTTGARVQESRVSRKLGDLLTGVGVKVNPETPPSPPADPTAAAIDFGGAKKLVVRRERKGRGGKTATVVEGIRVSPSALERIAREMRRALGCGASVDEGCI